MTADARLRTNQFPRGTHLGSATSSTRLAVVVSRPSTSRGRRLAVVDAPPPPTGRPIVVVVVSPSSRPRSHRLAGIDAPHRRRLADVVVSQSPSSHRRRLAVIEARIAAVVSRVDAPSSRGRHEAAYVLLRHPDLREAIHGPSRIRRCRYASTPVLAVRLRARRALAAT